MKKILFLLFTAMILLLAACGNDTTGSSDASSNDTNDAAEEKEDNTESEDKKGETMTSEENESKEAKVGDVVTNEAGDSKLVSRTDDIGTFESGPIKLTIEKANGVSMAVSDDYIDFFETDQLEYIQVDMSVENTSDENITFYASQAVMTTSTGEQLESDMIMSDHIDGEYIGAVKKSGSSFYILENSNAEDVESIRLIFSAASDENYDDVGEKIDIEIELNK